MLLADLIALQHSEYAQVQVEIDQLLERQRNIQTFLQRLGSVESKMESAAQLMQEAIAEIRNTCPDELNNYQVLVTSFFGDIAGRLEAGSDTTAQDAQPTSPPEQPEKDVNPEITNTTALVETSKNDAGDAEVIVKVVSSEIVDEDAETKKKREDIDFIMAHVNVLSWNQYQTIASRVIGVAVKNMSKKQIANILTSHLSKATLKDLALTKSRVHSFCKDHNRLPESYILNPNAA